MRCTSCNEPLKENEIIWRADIGDHETLCLRCRRIVFGQSEEDLEAMDLLDSTTTKDGSDSFNTSKG